ncbi:Synaptotagmin-5 [Tetrabaena socialis]|uniref:Synaptotagmin-5 n=1 Tax=Tetrabaena socialis TaxID=47790 RepID=A0A2J8AGU4_9CHLO|nr:Synaptotagmin-5 [Tetrabaena socialis]|eukprot:PNH11738.1 Synaptotagmin-5 [Tetrabaena socialis]
MAATEYITCLTIVSAEGLPKTDRLSKIDPYVVVNVNGQQFKTGVKDNNESPVWNAAFHPCVQRNAGGAMLSGAVDLNLFDEDTFSDSLVAKCTFDLATITAENLGKPVTLALEFVKDKYKAQGRSPTITIKLEGLVQSFNSMRAMFASMPGFLTNDRERACYIPIQESAGLLYVAVEYEANGKMDFKVYVTRPNVPVFLDMMVLTGRQYTKVRRRLYREGHAVVPGLTVYEELKLDDVPLNIDFNQLSLVVFDSKPLSSTNADQASKALVNVQVDQHKQEIYMPVDAGETMLLVDYDKDDADIKLAVLATPSTADKGYDLTIRGQNVNKMSELYVPPIPKLGGRVMVSRLYELDDLAYGTRFEDIEILRYHLSNPRQYTIQGITRIMG